MKRIYFISCHFMLRKLSQCIKNRFYAKSYTSRPYTPEIAVNFWKMASPDQIWYRGSLTSPIVAKGLKDSLKCSKIFWGYFINLKYLNQLMSTFKICNRQYRKKHDVPFHKQNSKNYKFQKALQVTKVAYLVAWKIIFIKAKSELWKKTW